MNRQKTWHVRALLGIGLGDGASFVSNSSLGDGQNAGVARHLHGLLLIGIAGRSEKRQGLGGTRGSLLGGGLLVLLGGQREHDELSAVLLQTLSVQLQRLLRLVVATVVNANSQRLGLVAVDLCLLELLKSEATASAQLAVILSSGASDDGAKRTSDRARGYSGSLGLAGIATANFAGGLIKPSRHSALPVLVEMLVGYFVVVLNHFNRSATKH
jgi:hypothetical protein